MKRKHFWQSSWVQVYVLLVVLEVVFKPTEAMQRQTFLQNLFMSSMSCFFLLLIIYAIVHSRRNSKKAKQEALRKRDETWRNIKEKEQYLKNKKPSGDPITTCRGCGAPMPVNEPKCPYCGLDNPHYSKY